MLDIILTARKKNNFWNQEAKTLQKQPLFKATSHVGHTHLFRANTIKFLNKTFATQHLTPQNDPQNDPQKRPKQINPKKTQNITFQKEPSRPP